MKRSLILTAILLTLILILVGCSNNTSTQTSSTSTSTTATSTTQVKTTTTSTPAAGQPQYGGKLVLINNNPITGVGAPCDAQTYSARNTIPALETLFQRDSNGAICEGALATGYDVAPDGKSITLHLRKGIQFTDGTPFNADAVKTNFEMDAAAKIQGSASLASVASYEVVDDNTLRVNTKNFDATLLDALTGVLIGQIASPTAIKKPTTPENMAKDHVVGTGPFLFDSWERDNYIKYKKNPNYWQKGKPYLDEIEIRFNSELTVTVMALRAGDAHWIENIEPVDALALQKDGFFTSVPERMSFIHGLTPTNNPNSPLANVKVREAVEYAIDKETITKGVGMGYYRAPYQLAMPEYPYYVPELAPRKYDVNKAKQLLTEAGYPNGVTIPLVTDPSVKKDILTGIQQNLKDAGINTTLDMTDMARMSDIQYKSGWDGLLMRGMPAMSNDFYSWKAFGVPYNAVSMIRRSDWDQRYTAIVTNPDATARYNLMKEMVKIIYDDVSLIPFNCDSPLYALSPKIHDVGWSKNGFGNWFDAGNAWLSK